MEKKLHFRFFLHPSLNELMNVLMVELVFYTKDWLFGIKHILNLNDNGVCRAAPGLPGSAKKCVKRCSTSVHNRKRTDCCDCSSSLSLPLPPHLQPGKMSSPHYTLVLTHYTLHTIHYTLHTTLRTTHYTLHVTHYTLHYTLRTTHYSSVLTQYLHRT